MERAFSLLSLDTRVVVSWVVISSVMDSNWDLFKVESVGEGVTSVKPVSSRCEYQLGETWSSIGWPCHPALHGRWVYWPLLWFFVTDCVEECRECKFCTSGKTNLCGKGTCCRRLLVLKPQLIFCISPCYPGSRCYARWHFTFQVQWQGYLPLRTWIRFSETDITALTKKS